VTNSFLCAHSVDDIIPFFFRDKWNENAYLGVQGAETAHFRLKLGLDMEKILLIDDELDKLELTVMNLSGGGFKVQTASTGLKGIELARTEQPDLILLDINMPGINGGETCHRLKLSPETQAIPVVMLTCNEDLDLKLGTLDIGADDYLIKDKIDYRELNARVKGIINRTRQRMGCNPLSGLPGNVAVEKEILKRITENSRPWAVVYADLDSFKPFNDTYGFALGDDVIKLLANTITRAVREYGYPEDFIGHIGGDDLIFTTRPDRLETICPAIIADFDRAIIRFYNDADRKRGYIVAEDRDGQQRKFSFVSVTLAAILSTRNNFAATEELAKWAGDVKHQLKMHPGSKWGY
jgi:PleD family two-component response regulator